MWCTQCHIPFSWKSGLRVNGVVHNPHFYQWQRDGVGAAPIQTPGAQTCGGLPTNKFSSYNITHVDPHRKRPTQSRLLCR